MKLKTLDMLIFMLAIPFVSIHSQKIVWQCDSPKTVVALPEKPDGRAVVICPGGGYNHAAKDKEADDWIPFFTKRGIAVATIKYTLPNGNREIPMNEVRNVFKLLKSRAKEWNINPQKIGIMGSSAGGHLATSIATHEAVDDRPAFQILFYPVISLLQKEHQGMAKRFLGTTDKAEETFYSSHLQVDSLTPPTIMLLTNDDVTIHPQNSISYYSSLRDKGVSATMQIYPYGGHGFGFADDFPYHDEMLADLSAWLDAMKEPARVILTAGQSNTDGRVDNSELPDYIKQNGYKHCVWSFESGTRPAGGKFKRFYPAINSDKNPNRWAYDAVVYHKTEQLLQREFYVIKESHGGTAIDTLCKSSKGLYWQADSAWLSRNKSACNGGQSLLKAFTENIGLCIDKRLKYLPQGYKISAMLWHQGESDYAQGKHYYDNMRKLISYVRSYVAEKTGDKSYLELPIIMGTVAKSNKRYSADVEKGMRKLARKDKNVILIDMSDATLLRDQLHFDAKSAERLGNEMFEKLKPYL